MAAISSFLRRLFQGAVLRQGAVVLLDQGLLSVANFLTGVLVARACTREDYGIYVLGTSILMIAIAFYRNLVHVPFTVFLPRLEPAERDRYQGSALVQTGLIAGAFSLGLVTAPVWTEALGFASFAEVAPVAGLLALVVLPFVLRDFARNALFSRLQFFSSVTVSVVATLFQLGLTAWFFFTGRLTLDLAFGIVGATCLVAAALMLLVHAKQMRVAFRRVWPDFLRGWHISRWLVVNVFGMIGTSQAYPWLLLVLADAGSVALYGAAFALAGVTAPLVQAATAYALPKMSYGFAGGDLVRLRDMLRRSMTALLIPFLAWTVVGGFFAEELMTLLYSDRYGGAATVVVLLLLRSLVEGVSSPMNPTLEALEQTHVTTKALLLGTVVTLSLGWWAISGWGVVGAAAASLATSLVVAGYRYWRLKVLVAEGSGVKP